MTIFETKLSCYDVQVLKNIKKSLKPSADSRFLGKVIADLERDLRKAEKVKNEG